MNKEFIEAINELETTRQIPKEVLLKAIEMALVSAYKKNYSNSQNVRVEIDEEDGEISVLARMEIVEEVYDDMIEMSLEEAQEIDQRYDIGDFIEFQVEPKDFGRIAAQTAKQVVVQQIREAERNIVFDDYVKMQGEIKTGIVNRINGDIIFVDIDNKAEGIMPSHEQVPGEKYKVNDYITVYIMDVKKQMKGPQVFLSRTHPGLVEGLFKLEVPEIQDGTVEIKSVSREAGFRSKVCVYTELENVDPVGACVGPRGYRVQQIVDKLGGEKIDIIPWDEDPKVLIANVLSPAQVEEVIIEECEDPEEKMATVIVADYQLSLAIGKEGQNVRLAAKASGWKIDIKSETQYEEEQQAKLEEDFDEIDNLDINQNAEEFENIDQIEDIEEGDLIE